MDTESRPLWTQEGDEGSWFYCDGQKLLAMIVRLNGRWVYSIFQPPHGFGRAVRVKMAMRLVENRLAKLSS